MIGAASRDGRGVALAALAEPPAGVAVATPAEAEERLRALQLRPHMPDRGRICRSCARFWPPRATRRWRGSPTA